MSQGRIEVIVGSMFSGKSEELIRRVRRASIARQIYQVFKHQVDDRYATHAIVSHVHNEITCLPVASSEALLAAVQADTRVVAVDEAQFFDSGIILVAQSLATRGVRVILAGLDTDSDMKPFGPMSNLMAVAEQVDKLHAVCLQCGGDASFTYHKGSKSTLIEVGASQYEARCRGCWND